MLTIFFHQFALLTVAAAQHVGKYQNETHPKLTWKKCTAESCETVNGEITLDANWRWLHNVDGYINCYDGNWWSDRICNTSENCTANCALEGAGNYRLYYGITSANDSISLGYVTRIDFAKNVGSRVYMMESTDRYQMFTLLGNEFAFDVDLSTVECGINSALKFVAMDQDGGMAKYPTNKAGAEYGTGYCDATCSMDQRFVGGKANNEGWRPSEWDPNGGTGPYGACCAQFSLWDSNAHSYSVSSHACVKDGYFTCTTDDCDSYPRRVPDRHKKDDCERWGCNYNPYRMGATDFYGKGKKVDTSKNFTVVTRFDTTAVTQFFIQDGKKIDAPAPVWDGFPKHSGLSAEMCSSAATVFDERDNYNSTEDWTAYQKLMSQPMVLAMSINGDYWAHNRWLDSQFPPEKEDQIGALRGDCVPEDNDPAYVENMYPRAKVTWRNIRFGPIGSTVPV